MSTRDLVASFRSATFQSDEAVEEFAAASADAGAADVEKLLEALLTLPFDAQRTRAFRLVAERLADKSLFLPTVRALRSAEPALRSALLDLLPRINSVPDHPSLVVLLRSTDAPLRQSVARVLPTICGRSSFEALAQMIGEPGFVGRSEAMDALVAMAPQHAAPALCNVLGVGSPVEKSRALRYLGEPRCAARDPARVIQAVATAVGDPVEAVMITAISALAALATDKVYLKTVGPILDAKSVPAARAALEGLRHHRSPQALSAIGRKLRSGPNTLRLAALDALEQIGTSDVLGPLVEALGHSQLAVRQRAGEALSRLSAAGKLDLARTVIWLLRSRDVNVRRMAVELVQTMPDPGGELWPKLLASLRDEDWWVRERVMDALTEMAGEALVPHVATFLNDPDELIRRFGVDALMRLRSPAALGALVRTAGADPDWWVRERAIEAVGAIGDRRAAPHLIEIMRRHPQLRVACLNALGAMKPKDAGVAVAQLLSAEDGDVQLAALHCLGVLDDPTQGSAVLPLVRDSRTQVRILARELVKRWGERSVVDATLDPVPVLDQILVAVARYRGDDLILAPDRKPFLKSMRRMVPLGQKALTAERVRALLVPHLSAQQLGALESGQEVDFSYRVESEDLRFRVNVFQQLGGVAAVFRIVRAALPDVQTLGLPPSVLALADLPNGLVLVGGAAGAGKSTTLAALIDHINATSRRHIVTLEDPIEVVHPCRQSLVNQRELGTHTGPLGSALRATLRQDPDVILVGEVRDVDTLAYAMSAAETGHLVFGTIHTMSAAGTVDRMINAFPAGQQDHVRGLIAGSLRAVICQYLLTRKDGSGRVLAAEVMLNNEAVANLIRKGKTFQIPTVIATSREQGMQLMDTELLRLAREGIVLVEEAHAKAVGKKEFEALLEAELKPTAAPESAIGQTVVPPRRD